MTRTTDYFADCASLDEASTMYFRLAMKPSRTGEERRFVQRIFFGNNILLAFRFGITLVQLYKKFLSCFCGATKKQLELGIVERGVLSPFFRFYRSYLSEISVAH